MADFVRQGIIISTTMPIFPSGLISWGWTGKAQIRDILQVGRIWEEAYDLQVRTGEARSFMAYVNNLWRNRTIFEILHFSMQAPRNDPITGSLSIDGAGQTGDEITVSTSLSKPLLQGDIIKIAGLNIVRDVIEDMTSASDTTIKINPPIFDGESPTDGASITYDGVKFRAVIAEGFSAPSMSIGKLDVYVNLTVPFREAP